MKPEMVVRVVSPVRLRGPVPSGGDVADSFDVLHFEIEVAERRFRTGDWPSVHEPIARAQVQIDALSSLARSIGSLK